MSFKLEFIDHVAIRVQDMDNSIDWYEKVLGLTTKKYAAWGAFPVFMASGDFAVALFPANLNDPAIPSGSRNVKIDHFAFRVDEINFTEAIKHFKNLKIDYQISDHHYFESVYIYDPNGHCVELTRVKPEN